MKIDLGYIYLVIAMGIVTYLPRMLPATLLSNRKIPEFFIKFLRFVPAAVLSALFFPGVIMAENKLNITFSNPLLLASLLTFPIAYKTRNMFATVLSGMGFVILFNYII
ncbi:AzlD domain-containing protein [Tepidanaerobacter acetatoxydans]|uniref:AzlD domain-containing protein n=1 Tax=Tepidanaerobacter acetatoxydans TaxID=499229 RepID=UPI00020BFFC6|nr:AzlD domain-containing protein [Tepidanaerobacter acetatoxydans]AEE91744.1 branched-chain amino acid transport [Tepidanaerobacter acetatoxydans Re1]